MLIKKENHGKTTENSKLLKGFTYFQAALYVKISTIYSSLLLLQQTSVVLQHGIKLSVPPQSIQQLGNSGSF